MLERGDDAISADGENWPKIAFGAQGVVLISYTQPLAKPFSALSHRTALGRWRRAFHGAPSPHADRQIITHRFRGHGLDGQARHTLWIDKRDLEAAKREEGHAARPSTATSRRRRRQLRAGRASLKRLLNAAASLAPVARRQHGRLLAPRSRRTSDHGFALLGRRRRPGAGARQVSIAGRWTPARTTARAHAGGIDGGYHAVWFGERADTAAGALRAAHRRRSRHRQAAAAGRRRRTRRPDQRRGDAGHRP